MMAQGRPCCPIFPVPGHFFFFFFSLSATMDLNFNHFSQRKTCPYQLLQHNPPLSVLQTVIFSPKIWLNTHHPSFLSYTVAAHFPLWWKTFGSHNMLRLPITLEATPEPSFTKHSLTQSQQQSNEKMKDLKDCWTALITEILVTNSTCLCSN